MSSDDSASIFSPRIIARPLFLSFTIGHAGSAFPFGSAGRGEVHPVAGHRVFQLAIHIGRLGRRTRLTKT